MEVVYCWTLNLNENLNINCTGLSSLGKGGGGGGGGGRGDSEDNCPFAAIALERVLKSILHWYTTQYMTKWAKSAEGLHTNLWTHVHHSTCNIWLGIFSESHIYKPWVRVHPQHRARTIQQIASTNQGCTCTHNTGRGLFSYLPV